MPTRTTPEPMAAEGTAAEIEVSLEVQGDFQARGVPGRPRVYEGWEGNEVILCNGRVMIGRSWKAGFATLCLIIAPAVVFLYFIAPYLSDRLHVAVMVFSCLLSASSVTFWLTTAVGDPGIIPRQKPDEQPKPRLIIVDVNGEPVTLRYNDTLGRYQPPRAHHCSQHDNCYDRMDHHCPWIGTTIAMRNYRSYLCFLASTSVLCLYVMALCVTAIIMKRRDVGRHKGDGHEVSEAQLWRHTFRDHRSIIAAALIFYAFGFGLFVWGLLGFHVFLTSTNQSTFEYFRNKANKQKSPYNMGFWANWAQVCCTAVPPSRVDLQAYTDQVRDTLPSVPPTCSIVPPSLLSCIQAPQPVCCPMRPPSVTESSGQHRSESVLGVMCGDGSPQDSPTSPTA